VFIEKAAQLKKDHFSLRREVRNLALNTLSWLHVGGEQQHELFSKPRVQFLYIHHVFRDEEKPLEKLLTVLAKNHHFIPYSEAVSRILTGNIDKPYICISSDDGLKNNLRAAEILNAFGASGCFFVCPSIIGQHNDEYITAFCKERLHFPPVEFLNWNDIEKLQQWGHEIGGHTMTHVNLAETPLPEMEKEIAGCYEAVKQACGKAEHFAYPYGRYHHFNDVSRQIAFRSGFNSFASAERGCHVVQRGKQMNNTELLIRRDHVILTWPLKHILYFLLANSKKAAVQNNYFPQ
jgi:peptidoglycan/xylan/chitin deacetylase (PgdA/CDA1 family)